MKAAGLDLRLKVMAGLIGAVVFVLVGRLWMLQITRWTDYYDSEGELRRGYGTLAEFNRTALTRSPAPRGIIYDREGHVLATTRPVWSVAATSADLPDDDAEREKLVLRLASILGASSTEVRAAIDRIREGGCLDPLPLGDFAEDIPFKIVAQVEEGRLDLPGIKVVERFQRHYPYGNLAAHVLGYARAISEEQYQEVKDLEYPPAPGEAPQETPRQRPDKVYAPDSEYGQTGIEAALELDRSVDPPVPVLQGRHGVLKYEVDRRNRPLRLVEQTAPQRGADVYLTLDLDLQKVAEEALHPVVESHHSTGAVVLMDVRTGEVLVMCSRPSIDPNRWVAGFSDEEYQRLQNSPRHPFYNKAIAGEYPPGSVFKMVSAIAALQTTSVSPSTTFMCKGKIHVGAEHRRFECWKKEGHGRLNFYEAISQSCDVYFYELVRKAGLTSEAIARYAREFGLGTSTQCGLPGEASGLVPDRAWKLDEKDEGWWTGDTLQLIIGQSFLTVTPLQMTVVTAAVANRGKLLKPQLVRKIVWPEYMQRGPTLYQTQVVREVKLADETWQVVRGGMRRAVTSKDGTAHIAAVAGLPLAAKTGSAEFHPRKKTHAWFCCYAPYDKPRFACTVFVSEGGYGSTTAGPVAAQVMRAALKKYGG